MCPWIGLHFHDWVDYNGVAHYFLDFGGKKVLHIFSQQMYQSVHTVGEKYCSNFFQFKKSVKFILGCWVKGCIR